MDYILQRGPLRAAATPQGGELISLVDGSGAEYIWGGNPDIWSGRNPILFPIVGNLKDGTVRFAGQPYHMNRHGFARNSLFSVVEQGADYIIFELRESEVTLAQYPYPFRLRARHQLTDTGFFTRFEVTNPGDTPMPFCIGAHTAFRCPLRPGEQFEQYHLIFDQSECATALIPTAQGLLRWGHTGLTLNHSDTISLQHSIFDQVDTLIFEQLSSTGVRLVGPGGHGVHMAFEGFPIIAFWTMANANAPYICLEPWHGCAAYEGESGEFADKPHCITLQPGQSKSLCYTVSFV